MIDDVLDETYGDMKRMAETERIGEFRSQGPALGQRTNDDEIEWLIINIQVVNILNYLIFYQNII